MPPGASIELRRSAFSSAFSDGSNERQPAQRTAIWRSLVFTSREGHGGKIDTEDQTCARLFLDQCPKDNRPQVQSRPCIRIAHGLPPITQDRKWILPLAGKRRRHPGPPAAAARICHRAYDVVALCSLSFPLLLLPIRSPIIFAPSAPCPAAGALCTRSPPIHPHPDASKLLLPPG